MDEKKPSKEERGNVRYLWVLVGAYLLYLAWNQLQLFLQGEVTKTGDILICVVSGVVFAAVGAWVIYREWRAWRYAQAHKDDPETWGASGDEDAPEEGNASADDDAPESGEDGNADALELAAPESDEAESAEESGDNGGEGTETEVEERGSKEPDDESDDDDEKPDAGKA